MKESVGEASPPRRASAAPRAKADAHPGPDQPVVLRLIEIPHEKAMSALSGVAMELEDCAFPLLQDMVLTSDLDEGFKGGWG